MLEVLMWLGIGAGVAVAAACLCLLVAFVAWMNNGSH
jgi:hypothetical protein